MTAGDAARHWDEWQARQGGRGYVDWADHPAVMALLQRELFGDASVSVLHFLESNYPQFGAARAVSLCCGDGAFERLLVEHGIFGSVVGTDLSPVRVAHANAARGALASRLQYVVGDANDADFGEQAFDVVFAKAALHHIENLEGALAGMRRALKPGGRLVTIDFFGPTRFQWTDAQLAAANRLLDAMPAELVTRADGSRYRAERPTVEAMIALDPSEAVRAGELYGLLRRHFTIEHDFAAGGALLNLVLDGSIVNLFDPANEAHDEWIRRAFRIERELMATGEIASDFRFIVAR
ncbi:MAG: class I SAM-dependent methyltransferase [Burkholderiales bacterium]|nr:class I SAM-dependent methyltransferase [Burkholderiales bacterium]